MFLFQSVKHLFKVYFCDVRNLCILVGHWILHAYAIISMTQLTNLTFHLSLLAVVPLPVFFYIGTVKFTDPAYVEKVSHVDISTSRYSTEPRATNLQFWNTWEIIYTLYRGMNHIWHLFVLWQKLNTCRFDVD